MRKIHQREVTKRKLKSRGQELGMGIRCAIIVTREAIFNILATS